MVSALRKGDKNKRPTTGPMKIIHINNIYKTTKRRKNNGKHKEQHIHKA